MSRFLKKWYPFIILASICLIAYLPSLGSILRGESWQAYAGSFGQVMPPTVNGMPYGDNALFRPLMYLVDWFEYKAFGWSPIGWRIIALALHIGVVLSLYRVLKDIKNSWIPLLFAGFFATSPLVINQVLYVIIAPYMIFTILFLNALYYLRRKNYIIPLILLIIATFIYEQGFVLCGVIGIWLLLTDKKKWSIPFISVAGLYVMFFIWRIYQSPLYIDGSPVNNVAGNVASGLSHAIIVIPVWIFTSVIHYYKLNPTSNIQYPSVEYIGRDLINNIYLLITLVVVTFGIYKISTDYHGSKTKEHDTYMPLLAGLACAYILVICVVRAKLGLSYLFGTNEASYTFGTIMCILTYMIFVKFNFDKKYMIVPLIIMIVVGVSVIFTVNYQIAQKDKPVLTMVNDINLFVEAHNGEDFTFNITTTQEIQTYWDLNQNNFFYIKNMPQIFWSKYYSADNPTYNLYFDGKTLEIK